MENKNTFLGMSDVGQAETILNQFRKDFPKDATGAENLLNDLLEALYQAEHIVGDAVDFHNFAVSVSKMFSDNLKTIYIIEKGLLIHPFETDLLADAIKYGYSCGYKEKCQQWYNTLKSIDQSRWSWRAFSFSIDYLLDEWTSENQSEYSIEDIVAVAHDYQKMKPNDEDAWFSEYQIYAGTNQLQKGIQVLEKAIAKFRFCPRCWMRYADIMIDEGEFEKAEPIIAKMRKNPKTGEKINSSYMYFLDAQCKIARLYASDEYDSGEVTEEAVLLIYRAFRKALLSTKLRESVKAQIEEYIIELEDESGIAFPKEWKSV